MTLYQLWDPTVQFQTRSGKNLVNGTVEVTYLDRTQLAPVYDFDGKAIQNPVTLDENGRAAVYVEVDKQYTIHVYDQNMQLVYTQNICEYPKDTAITVPTIESTESIDATLAGNTYTLDVKEDYIKKFGSNIFVIQYGDTSKTLTDLAQYDTVLMQMNSKTFYLTELTDSNAHFMSCYQVAGSDCIETCDYDGSTWTEVSTVNFDIGTVIVSSTDVSSLTQTYDELKALTQSGRLYMTYEGNLMQAVFAYDSAKQIVFGCTYRSPYYVDNIRWSAYTISIEYVDQLSKWTTVSTTEARMQRELYANKGLELTDHVQLDIKPDTSLTFDSNDRLKLNYTTIEVDE